MVEVLLSLCDFDLRYLAFNVPAWGRRSPSTLGTLIDNLIFITKGIFCNVGDYGEEGTPDPIPNSEVKLFSADGTTS